MFNDFKKSLLIVLFLCKLPSMYAMENQSKNEINEKFRKAAMAAINNKFSKQEDLEIIKKSLDNGADINLKLTKHQITLLMFAVNFKKGDLVDYLLQRKADVNFCAPHNGLPLLINLFKATSKNEKLDMQIMESLLKHGASPNRVLAWKETPLFYAIRNGYNDAVKLLIEYKADVNLKDNDGYAPLRQAIGKKDFDVIKDLCKAGAVLHDIDPNSNTAMHYMIGKKNDEIENFIKHISFNNKKQNELFKQTIIGTFLTFKKLNELPRFPQICKDLQLYIIDTLLKKNCYDFVLPEVYKDVKLLKKISAIPNKENCTALQLLHHNHAQDQSHIKNVEKFFDPNLIKKAWEDFVNVYPNISLVSKDNVARIMYDSHLSLLNNK